MKIQMVSYKNMVDRLNQIERVQDGDDDECK